MIRFHNYLLRKECQCLNCEMTVAKNVVPQNIGPDVNMNLKYVIKSVITYKKKTYLYY